ncbi:MAG: fumarylacetoacetate hydrolase family protein [Cyclobacteriaceae bacterium]|nr:fumarylacetoacetate hydrolase family protein [Cyclobacteriaceae bacterium]
MKTIAIGRNYVEHIAELNNERPEEPVIFTKPDTAIVRNNQPFYIPDFSVDIHYEVELVLRIAKTGKNINERFAPRYYDAIGLGIDFTARDMQKKAKEKGLPWALAKGFDGSAPISDFFPMEHFHDIKNISFSLTINGELRQKGNSGMMLFSFDHIIAYVSKYITLKEGDLIFTGTPKGVGSIKIGDLLAGFIEDEKVLEFEIR